MTFEIGQLTFQSSPSPQPARVRPAVEPPAPPVPAAAPDVYSDVIPSSPPPEVLAEVDAAWERAAALALEDRELHFEVDGDSGRVIIEVRTMSGDVVRTIPPADALAVMSGAAV